MARTRGGGVISGASARSRRNTGKSSSLAGARGQRCPALPKSSPISMSSTETVAATKDATEDQALQLGRLSEGDCDKLQPQSRRSFTPGTRVTGDNPFTTGIPGEVAAVVDGDDAADVLDAEFLRVFDDELGDGDIGINDDIEHSGLDDIVENIVKYPSVKMGESTTSGCFNSGANQSNTQRPTAVRKSPLSPPKVPVWRMLYIDPDIADPKLVARLLGGAASQALGGACVFDVATDIVEALADVRGGAMWVYRGVFINESLIRHRRLGRGKAADTSIQGKHLAQFLRQVGMSRTRIILLVAGDVDFDTADAGAHGLSAVLRKPFTKTGFWNILRGMYLGGEPTAADDPPPIPGSPQACHGQHPYSQQTGSRRPEGAPLETEAAAAAARAAASAAASASRSSLSAAVAVGGPAAMPMGAPVLTPSPYPACLGFTPFTHPMVSAYHLGAPSLIRPSQLHAGSRRKYTKIAPREEDKTGAGLSAPLLDGTSPDALVTADDNMSAGAFDQGGDQGGLSCSTGTGGLGKGEGTVTGATVGPHEGDGGALEASMGITISGESKANLTRASTDDAVCPDPPHSKAGSPRLTFTIC